MNAAPKPSVEEQPVRGGTVFWWVAFAAVVVHGWSLGQPFLGEDFGNLSRLYCESEATAWAPLFAFFDASEDQTWYRPLVDLTYSIDLWIWGTNPMGFRATNLVLFGIVCGLTARLATRFTQSSYVGAIAGLLLVFSPSVPEEVTWVSARPDSVSMLFALLACHATLVTSPRPARFWIAGFFLAGILAKEWVAAMVPVLVAFRVIALRNNRATPWRTALRDTSLIWPALAIYFAVRLPAIGFGGYATEVPSPVAGQFWVDRADFLLALLTQVTENTLSGGSRYVVGALILTGLVWGIRLARHRLPKVLPGFAMVCVLWIIVGLAIHIPVRVDPRSLADSRYLLPSLTPLCVLLAIACRAADKHGHTRSALLAGGMLVLMGVGLKQSITEWHRAGDAMNALMTSVRELDVSARIEHVEIHGVPNTIGRARFGMSLNSFGPPFRNPRNSRVRFTTNLYVRHLGWRRASSYYVLLKSIRSRSEDTVLLRWNPKTLRIQPLRDPADEYVVRGRVVHESDRFELECSRLRLEFDAGSAPPAPTDHVAMYGSIVTVGGTSRFRVREVESTDPIIEIQPRPHDPSGAWLTIRHRPDSFYAMFISDGSTIDVMPGYGVVFTTTNRAILTGYLDSSGHAEILIGETSNAAGYLQVALFDTDGATTLTRCLCAPFE